MTYCADASQTRNESLEATASTGPCYLLLEDPGPWGPAVLRNVRLSEAARSTLARWQRSHGVRPLLIRQPWRTPGPGRRVFVVNARHRWVETTVLGALEDLAALDLDRVRSADGVGLTRHGDPLALVCTHGRHDPCCAMRGRPVAAALAQQHPELVWEASHLGGDRFAGNMVVLPRADYFGRLEPDTAPDLLEQYLAGRLDLDHHRGRGTRGWAVQAAEAFARRELGATGVDDVVVARVAREQGVTTVELTVAGCLLRLEVTASDAPPQRLTCHAEVDEPAPVYTVRRVG